MLITPQEIEIGWGLSNKNYYENLGYNFTKMHDRFLVNVNNLKPNCQSLVEVQCDVCSSIYKQQYSRFLNKKSNIDECKECKHNHNMYKCNFCGKQVKKKPSNLGKHVFCCKQCENDYKQKYGGFTNTQVEVACGYCGKIFKVKNFEYQSLKNGKKKNLFCSRKCQGSWVSKNSKGENNPLYKRITKTCLNCGNEYVVKKCYEGTSKFCSPKCSQLYQREKIKVACEQCGKIVEKTHSQINKVNHQFCSHKCADTYNGLRRKDPNSYETKKCEICEKEFTSKKVYHQRFCSQKCQGIWQSSYLIGEHANNFNHDYSESDRTFNCEWCGTEVKKLPNKIEHANNGGHIFCSQECSRNWLTKVWQQLPENKASASIRAVKMLKDGTFGHTDTAPQIIVDDILDKLKIRKENEYDCKYFSMDDYLLDYNLMIEIMGTYWHADPRAYKIIEYQNQKDRIKSDKAKHTYIKNNYNIEILYLWEQDIYDNEELIVKLIENYINHELTNYHSFNYHLDNDRLILNSNLIIPYTEYQSIDLNKIVNIHDKEKHSMKQLDKWMTIDCDYCGKEYEILKSEYPSAKTHCCSRECTWNLRKKLRNMGYINHRKYTFKDTEELHQILSQAD